MASIVYKWNGPVISHKRGQLGYEVRDFDFPDARLSVTSLDDSSWMHLKFCCHGMGLLSSSTVFTLKTFKSLPTNSLKPTMEAQPSMQSTTTSSPKCITILVNICFHGN